MSPERTLDEDSSDGASDHLIADETIEEELLEEETVIGVSNSGSGADATIVGDHVTVETSSPVPSPGAETTVSSHLGSTTSGGTGSVPEGEINPTIDPIGKASGSTMVLSPIPLDQSMMHQQIIHLQSQQQHTVNYTINNNNTSFKNHNNSTGTSGAKNILISSNTTSSGTSSS
uniref:Uncharacterized protein n=1 Tax=Anopheles culicifacies TaxID=139723 RepID=A0A182MB29_9DIPT